jgi:bifunctional non-homologous end joining protein LigD
MSELEEYGQKRDIKKSGEPSPETADRKGPLFFVVQKHNARRLHYDFRLEVDGVLKSWAIPKGPSYDPNQKRLAAMVEDHPVEYASFEGNIPKGEYGAGEVIVWDYGTYSPYETGKFLFTDRQQSQSEMRKGILAGKISFYLRGQRLKGSWTLVKVKSREKDWLLIKHKDEYATSELGTLNEDRSVLSGRTLEEIKDGVKVKDPDIQLPDLERLEGSHRTEFPGFLPPMLANLTDKPFSNSAWVFEPKLDGYRIITGIKNDKVTLWSRRGLNVTEKYAPLVQPLSGQPVSEAILDGEMVALDSNGKVSFEAMQQYLQNVRQKDRTPLIYYVFDVLYLDGYNLTGINLEKRKYILQSVLREGAGIRLVEYFETDGKTVYDAAISNGLEGIMAKRKDSDYQVGRRSNDWLKVKAIQEGDFIIGGYTAGEGNREGTLGALLLGYLGENNDLIYAGHVGSGFNNRNLPEIKQRLDRLKTKKCPFSKVPETNALATWVHPELVAEIKYSQWTRDGRLRAPVFLRIREDKPATEVRRMGTTIAPDKITKDNESQDITDLVEQLGTEKESFSISIQDSHINLGNVNKELWPGTNSHPPITKRQYLIYLAKVSPYLLPHLKDRPLTLSRYPDGIYGEHFWQKHWNFRVPEFVSTVDITDENGKKSEYMLCNNLATLMWLGQTADIEFHTWYSRISPEPDIADKGISVDSLLDYPDFVVLDIDPYLYSGKEKPGDEPEFNKAGFDKACDVAKWLKEVLDSLSLNAFIKTSGKTGLHVYLPVVRELDYKAARHAAETIGQFLMQRHKNEITLEWAVEKRKGKVFIDYGQNVRGKTLASVYSPRPNEEAAVSFPLHWDELGKSYPTDYTILTVPDLLKERGDVWRNILDIKNDLHKALGM